MTKLIFALLVAALTSSSSLAENRPDVVCVPASQRGNSELGCYVIANKELAKLPDVPLYWHLYTYDTQAAADAAKGNAGTVVESFGKVWLFAVAEGSWSPAGGKKVSRIGPLPISHAGNYTAEYLEATFVPGMKTRVHRHPGPEAWYVVAGEQCAEIPGRKITLRAGEGAFVPEGPPMVLWGTGTGKRQGLALVLHDTTQPMSAPAPDWTPPGLCAPK